MPALLSRYATPLITGLFLVSLVSGLALFLHVGPGGLHAMHEWLSLALVAPFALHVWRNWRPMTGYLGRRPMTVALAASALMAAPFLTPLADAGAAGGPPSLALARLVLERPAAEVAPLLGVSAEEVTARLAAAGIAVPEPSATLSALIRDSGESEMRAIAALIGERE